jgi:uncharacterized membrane protein YgcG
MRKGKLQIGFVLIVFIGLLATSSFAQLGLAQLATQPQGASLAGQAVLTAAKAVYANSDLTPAEKQAQLVDLLNEAVATGNESVIRYAIVAIMVAAGSGDDLSLAIVAINNSNAFSQYQDITAVTVTAVSTLLGGGGGTAGGDMGGGGGQLGGGDQLGGGSLNEFLQSLGLDSLTGSDSDFNPPEKPPVTPI